MCNPAALQIQKGKPTYEHFLPFITNNNSEKSKANCNFTQITRQLHKVIKKE